jgi:DNA-directed RNA polymerase specialized sigma24 family protein
MRASDIVHNAYVNVFSRLENEAAGVLSVRAEEDLRRWLRRFALNALSNCARDESRGKRDARCEHPGGAGGLDLPAKGPSVTSLVRRSERDERLDRAIESLPEVDRVLMRLRYWYDVGFSDLGMLLSGQLSDAARMAASRRIAEILAHLRDDDHLRGLEDRRD